MAPIEHQFMDLIQAFAPTKQRSDIASHTGEAIKVSENHDECD